MRAVVPSLKFYYTLSFRKGPSKSDRVHRGFGAGVDKTGHFGTRNHLTNHFCQLDLALCRHAKERSVVKL